jgi:TetR/AcrR family transcriptional regulator
VSLQTFYRYFESRDRLVFAVIADWIQQHSAELERAGEAIDDPTARLEFFVRRTLQPAPAPAFATAAQFVTSEHWRLYQRFPTEMAEAIEPFEGLLRREIERGVKTKSFTSAAPERDARVMTRTVLGSFHHLAFFPDGPEAQSTATDVWSFCLAALGGSKAPNR